MLGGLRTWWSAAVSAPFLHLSVQPATLALGAVIMLVVFLLSIILALRGLKPALIEKDYAGRHASGVNAGGVRQLARHIPEIYLE